MRVALSVSALRCASLGNKFGTGDGHLGTTVQENIR